MDADELMDSFFDLNSTKRIEQPKPQIVTKIKTLEKEVIVDYRRHEAGFDYAHRHRRKENEMLANQQLNMPSTSTTKVDSDSEDEAIKVEEEKPEPPELDVYRRYMADISLMKLPIHEKKAEILSAIEHNRVIVITAPTGTGKSSRVPQFILDNAYKKKQNCNIIISQPRRIAAITLAKRVALELKCDLGTFVGYQVGLDKQMDTAANSDTRILFCTTGVLLMKLINEKTMKRYTHVILDEAHERDIDFDLLLFLVRHLGASKNPFVKVILMSATLNSLKVAGFFPRVNEKGEEVPALIVPLNIKRPFEIKFTYLDDLEQLGATPDIIDIDSPGSSSKLYKLAADVLRLLVVKSTRNDQRPSFLVFLPGIQEIERFRRELLPKPCDSVDISMFTIIVLHSSIPTESISSAFDRNLDNKIVLATNIAESSVTIPGVRFVIDFCLTKYQKTDTATNMTQLKLDWASKMSLEQRAGRVGRTEIGQVIRLLFKEQYELLPNETAPEIQRASLETAVLRAKHLDIGSPSYVLANVPDPPNKTAILDAILVLKEIGGLTRLSKRGNFDVRNGDLTFAGKVMAKLPVDVRISKLIILGYVYSCLEDCIIIGAGLSSKSIFKRNATSIELKMQEYVERLKQAKGSGSDAIVILNVYRNWREQVEKKGLSGKNEKQWCELQMLDKKNLHDMHVLVEDIKKRLQYFQLDTSADSYRFTTDEKFFTIKMCIAGAFHPNIFMFGGIQPNRDDYRLLNNMNPATTVYFKKFQVNRIGQIYEQQIRKQLIDEGITDENHEMRVKFDVNSERVQVEFKPMTIDGLKMVPGEVQYEIYKAIKLRKLGWNIKLDVMTKDREIEFALKSNLGTLKSGKFSFKKNVLQAPSKCIYPKMIIDKIFGEVSHIESCGKFFFQPVRGKLHIEKQQELLSSKSMNIQSLEEMTDGYRLLVKHDNVFKRGKVLEIGEDEKQDPFLVLLIDYGNIVETSFENLYTCYGTTLTVRQQLLKLVFQLPIQCFECKLSSVIPSPIKCSIGWSKKTNDIFKDFIAGKAVGIRVYSFVDRIASVQLEISPVTQGRDKFLNDHLVNLGYAYPSDDSYMNLLDQYNREKDPNSDYNEYREIEDELGDDSIIPPLDSCLTEEITLDGAYSTLEAHVEKLCRPEMSQINIAPASVNQVLIDPYPNDGVKKVLIAASMSENDTRVTLHNTTIMPHLPGMACLLGLIFSPLADIFLTAKKTRYASILTGLGGDNYDKPKPHYGEHDCSIDVDIALDQKDFEMINELRCNMSLLMQTEPVFKSRNKDETYFTRNKVCKLLLDIMSKKRSSLEITINSRQWNWKKTVNLEKKVEAMYPKLPIMEKLMPLSELTRQDLKRHAQELERQAKTNSRDERIVCRLCEERLETIVELRLHVMRQKHKDRLLNIRDETLLG